MNEYKAVYTGHWDLLLWRNLACVPDKTFYICGRDIILNLKSDFSRDEASREVSTYEGT